MIKYNFTKTLTAGLALATALYPQAWACNAGYIEGVNTGNCIPAGGNCGTGCTYTIDAQGNLNITGNGEIKKAAFKNNKDIINANIADGIKNIGEHAFMYSSLESISIPSSVKRFGGGLFASTNLKELVIPDTASGSLYGLCSDCKNLEYLYLPMMDIHDWVSGVTGTNKLTLVVPPTIGPYSANTQKISASLGNIYCTEAQIQSGFCASDVNRYEIDNGNFIVYNKDGTIKDILHNLKDFSTTAKNGFEEKTFKIDDDGSISQTSSAGILAKYDAHGNLLSTYSYGNDGLIYTYNGDHKLIGAKKTTPFTPAEAAAAIKKGNNNKITLTFK